MSIGIAIITCKRPNQLKNLLESLYSFDRLNSEVTIFDDASNDGTEVISKKYANSIIQKINQGVIINKNAALYYFSEVRPKDYIILLEDDVLITESSWINTWVDAAEIYGHMNFTPHWFLQHHMNAHICGDGSVWSPDVFSVLTGQCTSIKTEVMKNSIGFLNPRFKGYGYGHVEWTNRFLEKGYGGFIVDEIKYYYSMRSGVQSLDVESKKTNDQQLNANANIYNKLLSLEHSQLVNEPWVTEADRKSFLEPFNSISYKI